jgi:hypothetical protein
MAMTDKEFLISRGWVETNKGGPWRWYRPEWTPISYYTRKDAVNLERSMPHKARAND